MASASEVEGSPTGHISEWTINPGYCGAVCIVLQYIIGIHCRVLYSCCSTSLCWAIATRPCHWSFITSRRCSDELRRIRSESQLFCVCLQQTVHVFACGHVLLSVTCYREVWIIWLLCGLSNVCVIQHGCRVQVLKTAGFVETRE